MEILALGGFVLFLPILSVLPAWQRMRREASSAHALSTDVKTLLEQGDRDRAISVVEQGTSLLAPSIAAAIRGTPWVEERPEPLIGNNVSDLAISIFSTVGVLTVGCGILLFCLNPSSLLALLFGLSMLRAGKMLGEARRELIKSQRLLLRTVRGASHAW